VQELGPDLLEHLPVTRFGVTLVLLLSLAAPSARAAIPIGHAPFGAPVCEEPTGVITGLLDPSTTYQNAKSCSALCKRAEKDCEQYVRSGFVCRRNLLADELAYAKINCAETQAKPLSCVQTQVQLSKAQLGDLQDELATTLGQCKTWGTTCAQSCMQP
jgi:hypothetical protein